MSAKSHNIRNWYFLNNRLHGDILNNNKYPNQGIYTFDQFHIDSYNKETHEGTIIGVSDGGKHHIIFNKKMIDSYFSKRERDFYNLLDKYCNF